MSQSKKGNRYQISFKENIQEIELMQSETEEIIDLISKAKFAKNRRVQSIKKQLNHLQRINDNLKARAEALLDME